jgi:hypothetical protein
MLSVVNAGKIVGVHPNTIRNTIRRGQLEAKLEPGRFGRDEYRISMPDLQGWAKARGMTFAPEDVDRLTEQCVPDRQALLRRVVQLEKQMATFDAENVQKAALFDLITELLVQGRKRRKGEQNEGRRIERHETVAADAAPQSLRQWLQPITGA